MFLLILFTCNVYCYDDNNMHVYIPDNECIYFNNRFNFPISFNLSKKEFNVNNLNVVSGHLYNISCLSESFNEKLFKNNRNEEYINIERLRDINMLNILVNYIDSFITKCCCDHENNCLCQKRIYCQNHQDIIGFNKYTLS